MSDFQESIPPSPGKSKAGGCIAIGCLSLVSLPLLGAIAANGGGSFISVLLVAAVVIFIIVKARKNNVVDATDSDAKTIAAAKFAERMASVAEQSGAEIRMPSINAPNLKPSNSLAGMYTNPICNHRFSESALESEQVACECGYVFNSEDLKQYQKLNDQLETLQDRIQKLAGKIRAFSTDRPALQDNAQVTPEPASQAAKLATASAIAQPQGAVAPAKPVAVAKPKPVRAARPKVNLSLQQWLIIGAAVLVMVAASVFVGNGLREGWPPQAFAGVTLGLSAVMIFGAFRLKNISVTLVNFAAVFAASMITASLMILGDQLSNQWPNDFQWDNAPAWWWAVSMALVSLTTTGLARFSGNFGFKAIGVLTSALSIGIFVVGHLVDSLQLPDELFGLYVASMSLAAVALLFQGKFLLGIERDEVTDKAFKAYAKQLAEREDDALRKFTLLSSGALAAIGASLGLVQASSSITQPGNPFALLSIAAVWVGIGLTSDRWSSMLDRKDKPATWLKPLASGIVSVSGMLAAVSVTTLVAEPIASSLLTLLVIGLFTWFASKLGKLAPNQTLLHTVMWVSVAVFAIWSLGRQTTASLGALVVGIAALLVVRDLRFQSSLYQLPSVAIGSTGFLVLAASQFDSLYQADSATLYAVAALVLGLASNLFVVANSFVAKQTKKPFSEWTLFISVGFSTVIYLVLQLQLGVNSNFKLEEQSAFLATFLIYSVSTMVLSTRLRFGKLGSLAISAHSYLGQVVIMLAVTSALVIDYTGQMPVATWWFASVALLNYGFAVFTRSALRAQLGFALALLTFYFNQSAQGQSFVVQCAVVAAALLAHGVVLTRRFKSISSNYILITSLATISFGFLASFVVSGSAISSAEFAELFAVNVTLSALAVISAVAAEVTARKNTLLASQFSWVSLLYAVASLATCITPGAVIEIDALLYRALLATFIVGAISLRIFLRNKNPLLLASVYLSNLGSALLLGMLTARTLGTGSSPEPFSMWLALALSLTTWLVRKHLDVAKTALMLDVPVIAVGVSSLLYATLTGVAQNEGVLRGLLASLVLATYSYLRKHPAWLIAGYSFGVVASLWLAQAIHIWLSFNFAGPEGMTILIAASVAIGNLLLVKRLPQVGAEYRWGAIVSILALPSLFYSLTNDSSLLENQLRQFASLLAISWFALTMIKRFAKNLGWVGIAYLSNSALMLAIAHASYTWFGHNYSGPEIYSLAAAGGILISNLLMKQQVSSDWLKLTLPVAIAALPSLVFSFGQDQTSGEPHLRRVLALAIISGYIFFMCNKAKQPFAWVIACYVTVAATLASLVNATYLVWNVQFDGPELYSLAIGGGVLLTQRLTKKNYQFEGSLFTWGLPLAVMLVPSTVYTFANLQVPFNELTTLQISRVVGVLAVSAVLLVLGIRRGNLASTAIGLLGLGAILVPGTAVHSNELLPGAQIESTALVLGILIYVLLSVLHKRGILKGTSAIYLGIPVSIVLAPSLLNSLAALGNPTLGSVDWWRFGLVLAAGLTLLIVGSLRELAGMFYPGLISVLLTTLPYGFKQSQDQAWFLWVLLLLVAGVMVWVAVRLEQIKKAGRNSTAWLKELK